MIKTNIALKYKGGISLVLVLFTAQAVMAAPHPDTFANTTDNNSLQFPGTSNTSDIQPTSKQEPNSATIWFAHFDELREKYRPSDSDKIILSRPLNQDSERVAQWTRIASKISKNYLTLSKVLRNTLVPPGLGNLKEYRSLTADWYEDSAGVYQDMIRPRQPAKTIEELQESLNEIKKRSQSLVRTRDELQAMDKSLRVSLHVSAFTPNDGIKQAQKQ